LPPQSTCPPIRCHKNILICIQVQKLSNKMYVSGEWDKDYGHPYPWRFGMRQRRRFYCNTDWAFVYWLLMQPECKARIRHLWGTEWWVFRRYSPSQEWQLVDWGWSARRIVLPPWIPRNYDVSD
jgi:hypothetical protein